MTNKNAPVTASTNAQSTIAAKLAETKEESQEPKSLVAEEKFQEYKSALSSVRLITDGKPGIRITFTNFKLLTQTKEVIEYLNKEIKLGLPGITKGALLSLDDVNPMQTLRREMEAKVRAEMAEEAKNAALGKTKDMGDYVQPKLNPAGSNTVVG